MKALSRSKRKLYDQDIERRVNEELLMWWQFHTQWHLSKMINGHRLCYWPTKNKWRYRGVIETGDVYEFIKKTAEPKELPIGNAN